MKKNYFERSKVNANQGSPNWLFRLLSLSLLAGLLSLNTTSAWAKSSPIKLLQKVTGKVTDSETGEALPGVAVVAAGRSGGVATDVNGLFQIEVPDTAARLTFSFIGYVAQTIDVGGKSLLEVKMVPDVQKLDQVVVVGYGMQKKSDITGATVHLDERALREVPAANLNQALQGKAAGLEIQRTGTGPGAGSQIRIRGVRSISGSNDPLFVLNGIPFDGDLNDINPDDVANIDILKDASATAIYGSRGANGVILITTKKGTNQKAKVSYNGYYGWSKVANKYPVFSPEEYVTMRNNSTWSQGFMPEELNSIATGQSTDWQDLMYQKAFKTDQNVSISGGNDGSTYSLGGGYYKETAVLPGQDFTRYSLRTAIDSKIGKRIMVGLNSLNSVGVTNGSQFAGNVMFPILALSPLEPAYNTDGSVRALPNGDIDDNNSAQFSPLLLKNNNNNWVDKVRRLRTMNSLYGEYEILDGLKYRANLGLTYSQQESDQFQSAYTATNPSYFRGFKGNTASVNNAEAWGYTLEHLLSYDKTLGKHHISFTGLFSTQEYHTHNTYVSKDSIVDDATQFYNLGLSYVTPYPTVSGSESSWALISYMARVNYVYNDRYMLTLTGRLDGSSRLAAGHKWHQYPAASAGWKISEEEFLKNVKVISSLKIRAGFGQTSNQAINPYSALGLVSNGNGLASPGNALRYNYGPTVVTGFGVNNLPNPNLDWEYTQTNNFGLDFGLLENRITGSIEYYTQKTHGILYNVNLPSTSGVSGAFTENVGKMENKGFELTLTTNNVQTKSGFTWSTDFNLFTNRNKLTELSSGVKQDIGSQLFVGQSMSAIYDYKNDGVWQTSEAAEAAKYGSVPGQIKLRDLNGDGKIDADHDRSVIGKGEPDVQGGMTNRFSFKGFDFSFVLYARIGGTLISQIHQSIASYLTNMDGKRNGIKVDYWTPDNPSNWFPSPQLATTSPISTAWTTLGYYDASFVKVRSINLGYTISNKLLKKISVQSCRFYVTVDNVATLFSPYMKKTGIDPESTAVGNQGIANPGNIRSNSSGNGTLVVNASMPTARSFSIGANVSF